MGKLYTHSRHLVSYSWKYHDFFDEADFVSGHTYRH